MTKNNKKILLSIIVLFIVMIVPMLASAQLDGEPPNPEESVPLDGGLSLLVAAGVGYGAKKLKARRALASSNKN